MVLNLSDRLPSAARLDRAHLGHQRILDVGRRGRHLVELFEEAVDGGRLLCGVGDVVAHQLASLAHRFVAEFQTELSAQLGAQEIDLAAALCA